jgi:hypothetical protein
MSFFRSGCFRSLRLGEERKQAGNGRKGKTMKLEEIKNKTVRQSIISSQP